VKQGREFRYYITMDGFRHCLDLIRLKKIEEEARKKAKEYKEKAEASNKRVLLASLRTKITSLQMEQVQLLNDKISGILNTTAAVEFYAMFGRAMTDAAESIRALQFSASRPEDQATRESAVVRGEEVCNKLRLNIILMFVFICCTCCSRPAENPNGGL
jgi:hypothetical protein